MNKKRDEVFCLGVRTYICAAKKKLLQEELALLAPRPQKASYLLKLRIFRGFLYFKELLIITRIYPILNSLTICAIFSFSANCLFSLCNYYCSVCS
jgi:hypothetical protein